MGRPEERYRVRDSLFKSYGGKIKRGFSEVTNLLCST